MQIFLDSILYSYAQIFFSNRKWFGAGALLISFFDPAVGAMGLLGVILSNAFALYLKFDKEKIRNGFYGFNGILIGAAIAFFFQLTPFLIGMAVIFIFLSFFLAASLENLMANLFNLPGLSLPFILTLYVFLVIIVNFPGVNFKDVLGASTASASYLPHSVHLLFSSLALIILQTNALAGALLLLLILAFSRVMFLNTLIAFFINYLVVIAIFPHPSSAFLLLTSFNAVLVAFALGGSMIILSKKTIPLLALTVLFVIVFTMFFENILSDKLLPVLVLPFNVVTLSTIYSLKFREENTDLALLYFKPGSPEENYYYHSSRTARFKDFKYLLPELPFHGLWKVSQAFDGEYTHKDDWRYAWDFVITDESGKEYSNNGNSRSDYHCFNTPVAAPLDGTIVRVINNVDDNEIGEVNIEQNWGNTVIIDHGEGLFSSLSHLKKKSITVETGDEVKKGQIIGKCGNSGRSPYPHLHFQFQLTDKLGDKTYRYPISSYIVEEKEEKNLYVFDFPKKDQVVGNLDAHKTVKAAFDFKLGDKLEFECTVGQEKFNEKWEIKVDIFNVLYIENNFGDRLNIYKLEKIFYATNYIGKRKSALYYFYLTVPKVPLGFADGLKWRDVYPLSAVVNSIVRYLSEFLLIFNEPIKAEGHYAWRKNENNNFEIISKLTITGKNVFSFYKKEDSGKILLESELGISEFKFSRNGKVFLAKRIRSK